MKRFPRTVDPFPVMITAQRMSNEAPLGSFGSTQGVEKQYPA